VTRASRILNELFQGPGSHYQVRRSKTSWYDPDSFGYNFDTPNGKYDVSIRHRYDNVNTETAHGIIDFMGPRGMGVTGGHPDSAKIFSTVHHVLKKHLAAHPEVADIGFTAIDKPHVKLYDHMVKRFAREPEVSRASDGSAAHYKIKRENFREQL
jgi:hypothetical protein